MEELRVSSETIQINQSIASQIRAIIERVDGKNGTWASSDRSHYSTEDFTEAHKVNLFSFPDEEQLTNNYGDEILELLPENLGYPLYTIQDLPSDVHGEVIETPYGRQRATIIGPDGKIYHFSNQYFFDEKGNAYRYEHVFTDGKNIKLSVEVPTVEVLPKEGDSRVIPINPVTDSGVYEKVGGILKQIREGEYKKSRITIAPGF